jgi:hypothetical protein
MLPIDQPPDNAKPLPRTWPINWLFAPLFIISWIIMAVVQPYHDAYVSISYLFGTMFGQTTLAAGWTVFGTQRLHWRILIALFWISALLATVALHPGHQANDSNFIMILMVCLSGQWALAQIPLWILAFSVRVRLRHRRSVAQSTLGAAPQFGIRQMMIFTTTIAVLLGIGRVLAPPVVRHFSIDHEAFIFLFLAVAAVVTSLPTMIAPFLTRFAIPATLIALLLIVPVTYLEWPLLVLFNMQAPRGPDVWHLIYLNVFTAGWVLVVACLMRAAGYRVAH